MCFKMITLFVFNALKTSGKRILFGGKCERNLLVVVLKNLRQPISFR